MPVTVAGHVCVDCRQAVGGCNATAAGRERDKRVPVVLLRDGEGEPVPDVDAVAGVLAAVEVESHEAAT